MSSAPDRNLALELVRVTEAAALDASGSEGCASNPDAVYARDSVLRYEIGRAGERAESFDGLRE